MAPANTVRNQRRLICYKNSPECHSYVSMRGQRHNLDERLVEIESNSSSLYSSSKAKGGSKHISSTALCISGSSPRNTPGTPSSRCFFLGFLTVTSCQITHADKKLPTTFPLTSIDRLLFSTASFKTSQPPECLKCRIERGDEWQNHQEFERAAEEDVDSGRTLPTSRPGN
jgi:hypothetical protein